LVKFSADEFQAARAAWQKARSWLWRMVFAGEQVSWSGPY